MNPIEKVLETLMDKGYDKVSAYWIMQMRGITPSAIELFDLSILPYYVDEEYINNLREKCRISNQKRREKSAEEFLIELNYWKPSWN